MEADNTEESATAVVVESMAGTPDDRLRHVLAGLVRHLHAFIREVEPTQTEWERGIEFLTEVGRKCDDMRQEFILLSDVLGVSTLVDAINNRKPPEATESTILGPFHVTESPARALGADVGHPGDGDRCVVAGRVLGPGGDPLPGALVDVWQANGEGLYDVQQLDHRLLGNLRGLFTTDDHGRYWFRGVVPGYYPIPDDGPVGDLLRSTQRHPNRPAHIHFIAAAAGHLPVTTHAFVAGSPYLDSDAVFGVKQSLIRAVRTVDDPAIAAEYQVDNPFQLLEFDIVLSAAPTPEDAG